MTDYGTDLACVTDLETTLGVVSGTRVVAEAIARRLQTPRGTLIGDPDYGFDLTGYCNDELGAGGLAWISSQIVAECTKDERVIEASAELELDAGDVMTATIKLALATEGITLVLAVSAVTVELLAVE